VDAEVVAVAVMMLYEAMLVANGGNNPFLTALEPTQERAREPGAKSNPAGQTGDGRSMRPPS
jgi:hypothetical protein